MTDPALVAALLESWLPSRRWYLSKHLPPRIQRVVLEKVAGPHAAGLAAAGVEILDVFVTDRPAAATTVYHVPLVRRTHLPEVATGAVLGRDEQGRWLIDAPHDPTYLPWLLDAAGGPRITASRVYQGEQSHTSAICTAPGGPWDIMVKLFRVLAPGSNPEVELLEALTAADVPSVPRFHSAGWGSWARGADLEWGHTHIATEFIPDAQDAWQLAVSAARDGRTLDAFGLGLATGQVHLALARGFPPQLSDADARTSLHSTWVARWRAALTDLPELAEVGPAVEEIFHRALDSDWPALQRIHGDLHLGQVLLAQDRGWVLLDFEGEPLRPLAERRRADLALRDVAGMLRSFDYAAGPDPGPHGEQWVIRAQEEFLDGYAEFGADPREYGALLTALQLDKALYEARYEAGSRPDWLPIPLRGINRLTAR